MFVLSGNLLFAQFSGGSKAQIKSCINTGSIIHTAVDMGYNQIGGIIGTSTNSIIENCINYGTIITNGDNYRIGGIIGADNNNQIQNCINVGIIISTSERIGGIVSP